MHKRLYRRTDLPGVQKIGLHPHAQLRRRNSRGISLLGTGHRHAPSRPHTDDILHTSRSVTNDDISYVTNKKCVWTRNPVVELPLLSVVVLGDFIRIARSQPVRN